MKGDNGAPGAIKHSQPPPSSRTRTQIPAPSSSLCLRTETRLSLVISSHRPRRWSPVGVRVGGGMEEGGQQGRDGGNDRYAQQLASRYRRQGHQRRRQVNDQSPGPLDHLLYRFDPLPAAPDPGRLDTKWTAPTGLHRHIALLSVFSHNTLFFCARFPSPLRPKNVFWTKHDLDLVIKEVDKK